MATPDHPPAPEHRADRPFGRQVLARRRELGVTQAQLADLAGLSRTTVHHIETGSAGVRSAALLAVADVLGCDVTLTPRHSP